MFEGVRRWFAERAMRRRIAALDPSERTRILAASPYVDAFFQGEGVRLYRKDTEGDAGFVDHLGECSPREAEDEIIRRWYLEGGT